MTAKHELYIRRTEGEDLLLETGDITLRDKASKLNETLILNFGRYAEQPFTFYLKIVEPPKCKYEAFTGGNDFGSEHCGVLRCTLDEGHWTSEPHNLVFSNDKCRHLKTS